jgi:hypothetical protein
VSICQGELLINDGTVIAVSEKKSPQTRSPREYKTLAEVRRTYIFSDVATRFGSVFFQAFRFGEHSPRTAKSHCQGLQMPWPTRR